MSATLFRGPAETLTWCCGSSARTCPCSMAAAIIVLLVAMPNKPWIM